MAEALRKTVPPARDEAPESPRPIAPVAPAEKRSKARTPAADKVRQMRRRDRVRWVLFALLPIALIVGGYVYVTGGKVMSTDDAYVDAAKVGISTDISGIVQEVDVTENLHVGAGQVLYRLDPRQFQIALDNAQANLAQTAFSIEAMKQDYRRMLSDTAAQQAQVDLDQVNYDRNAMLLHSATVSQAVFDQAHYTLDNDKSKLAALREQAQVQLAKLGGNPDIVVGSIRSIKQAQAQVEEAQRQLDHTVVSRRAFAGTVTSVPSDCARKISFAASTTAFLSRRYRSCLGQRHPERDRTDIRATRPAGRRGSRHLSGGSQWHGVVESISPAASQEFSLLPAQNTSGNWVKVVQRVPIRVRVDVSNKNNYRRCAPA
jgi:membrane fusion protein (multidrug efflux system)